MSYELIQTASVIRYPYLRAREAGSGETEGRKERPVAVGVRMPRPEGDLVLFFPITTEQQEASRFAREVPAIEKRRAGLDAMFRQALAQRTVEFARLTNIDAEMGQAAVHAQVALLTGGAEEVLPLLRAIGDSLNCPSRHSFKASDVSYPQQSVRDCLDR